MTRRVPAALTVAQHMPFALPEALGATALRASSAGPQYMPLALCAAPTAASFGGWGEDQKAQEGGGDN